LIKFANLSSVEAKGLELQLDARPAGPIASQLTYALQHAADAQGNGLTNSPRQVATLAVTGHRFSGLHGAVQFRHESGRRTLAGSSTSSFLRTDTNVGYRPGPRSALSHFSGAEIVLRVTNLFDVSYAAPAGANNAQDAIAADGRTLALHLEWRF
jgi:outer membrane receptor protein involved in Fe transport